MSSQEKNEPASPVCYLGESDETYAGYLTNAELARELRRLMARVKDDQLHAKLKEIAREAEGACPKD